MYSAGIVAVGFQLEHPMAVVPLEAAQTGSRVVDDPVDVGSGE